MKYQKITNLLGTTLDETPRFITKIWVKFHDQSGLSDDDYIVVKRKVTVTGGSISSRKNRPIAFKNNAPFTNCISKINNVSIENAEDLYIVMPI